jgi:hypothetical protein
MRPVAVRVTIVTKKCLKNATKDQRELKQQKMKATARLCRKHQVNSDASNINYVFSIIL